MNHFVKEPNGKLVARDDLLLPVTRWTALRKYRLLLGIEQQVVTREEVMLAHTLSEAELHSWQRAMKSGGRGGLGVRTLFENRKLNRVT